MKRIALKTHLALLLVGSVVQPAFAGSYCIRNQVLTPLCIYDDPQECQRDAQKQGAECDANPRDVRVSGGYGKYCVVTAGGVSDCNYTDPGSCAQEANRKHGACVVSPTRRPFQAPDPFSPVEGN